MSETNHTLDKIMSVRVSVQEYEQIKNLAAKNQESVGEWVRWAIKSPLQLDERKNQNA
jgi:predicted HicB family RNase H-like nuclease